MAITGTLLFLELLMKLVSDDGWIAETEKPLEFCDSSVLRIDSCCEMSIFDGSWNLAFMPSSLLAFVTPCLAASQYAAVTLTTTAGLTFDRSLPCSCALILSRSSASLSSLNATSPCSCAADATGAFETALVVVLLLDELESLPQPLATIAVAAATTAAPTRRRMLDISLR